MATYRSRVSRRWPAEDLAVRPAPGGRKADPQRALAAEAEKVRGQWPEGWRMVTLDEGGTTMTSVEFARWLADQQDAGVEGLLFVVGSDLGLDKGLQQDAARVISVGRMTLPHRIARLVLWEQLFRATAILGGGGYHRHRVQ